MGPFGAIPGSGKPKKERPPLFDTAKLQAELKDKTMSPFNVGPFDDGSQRDAERGGAFAGSLSGFMSSAMYESSVAQRGGASQLHALHRGAAREINLQNPS